jgi:peptidoglycan/LPS O-acetylase OafA/YrhL
VGSVGRARLPYTPALEGLRGLAVAAVVLFHAGVPGVRGGHLGVTAFFTLSGFLITALLLVERTATGRVDLRAFWVRRARRLVPAVLVCLLLVALVLAASPEPASDGVTWDALAAATWVANWRFVADGQTYADLFALPSPFQHFWSLAVEEQFYVVYPLLVVALLGSAAVQRTRRLVLVLAAVTVLSTAQLWRLAEAGGALDRAYYGTDARVAELLVGALLALAVVRGGELHTPGRWADAAGAVGLVGLVSAVALLEKGDPVLYRGGYLAVALCTAAVIAAAPRAGSPVARVLSLQGLVVLGIVSYGVYIFHWPLFLLLTESFLALDPVTLFLVRIGASLGLAWLSFELVEWPARTGQAPVLLAAGGWTTGAVAGVAAVALAAGHISLPTPARPTVPPPNVAVGTAPAAGAATAPQPGTARAGAQQQAAAAPQPAPGRSASSRRSARPRPARRRHVRAASRSRAS